MKTIAFPASLLRRTSCPEDLLMKKYNDSCCYSIFTKMTFGQYKGITLKDVHMFDPDYIQWLIINSDGFVVHPDDFVILENKSVFDTQSLSNFIEDTLDSRTYDFSSFSQADFLFHPDVKEIPFSYTQETRDKNKMKIEAGVTPDQIMTGGSWKSFPNTRTNKNFKIHVKLPSISR